MGARAWVAILVLALAGVGGLGGVATSAAAAAEAPPPESLTLSVHAPGHVYRHVLDLTVYAEKGVAVLLTETSDDEIENDRGVSYATRVPKGPLDRRVEVHFRGLGQIVGRFVGGGRPSGSQACEGSEGEGESGHFVGRLVFHGSGGYGTWRATRVSAEVRRGCSAEATRGESVPKTLFGYLDGYGPGFSGGGNGPFSNLDARIPGRKRSAELLALVYGRGPEESLTFLAYAGEYLGDGVVCERWAKRSGIPRRAQFEIAPGATHPPSATIKPPAPFSGEATYSHKDGSFLGDLEVHLLGRTVRLAGPTAEAFVSNSF
jgi:hypothetical protein